MRISSRLCTSSHILLLFKVIQFSLVTAKDLILIGIEIMLRVRTEACLFTLIIATKDVLSVFLIYWRLVIDSLLMLVFL